HERTSASVSKEDRTLETLQARQRVRHAGAPLPRRGAPIPPTVEPFIGFFVSLPGARSSPTVEPFIGFFISLPALNSGEESVSWQILDRVSIGEDSCSIQVAEACSRYSRRVRSPGPRRRRVHPRSE